MDDDDFLRFSANLPHSIVERSTKESTNFPLPRI